MPTNMVNKGVSAFKMPAKELSICVSAIQNKYAGKKLPNNPDKITRNHFRCGICLSAFTAKGVRMSPALSMRMDAT